MAVTALPTPPSRSDPATFAERGDAFMSALPTFQAEINALQITTNAQTAADAAASATSAAEAVVAKNAAIAAWAASMSPAETLPALSQSLHIGAVVKAIVYDTSKDSDGGAWRKRCDDKSWYTETLGGDRWIGQHATIAAAWTAAGSTTGAVYQASATAGSQTSGLYYTPTSSTTVTQVYRGVTREFPAVAGIVAESSRVVIYDLATGAMWMVFVAGVSFAINGSLTTPSLAAANGSLLIGNAGSSQGSALVNFASDDTILIRAAGTGSFKAKYIAGRNAAMSYIAATSYNIVNTAVNDVAITVLDSSPIDPATGLPVPTIAVATAGGVSVIKDDGTVVNSTSTGSVRTVCIDTQQKLWMNDASNFAREYAPIGTLGAGFADIKQYYDTSIPATLGGVSSLAKVGAAGASNVISTGSGLTRLKSNPTTPTKGMVAYVTTAYNSGWLPGDIRGAYLADTTAESITASGELVTNGTFTTDTSGWTGSNATLSVVSGAMRMTATGASPITAYSGIPTVVGKTYAITVQLVTPAPATKNAFIYIGSSAGASDLVNYNIGTSAAIATVNFIATSTLTFIRLAGGSNWVASEFADFDNISVKLAEPDRSVKNKGLVINGSLSKTAVASGAGLVAWSGFSASNYLEAPYDSGLDFGTGDFCAMGWVNPSSLYSAESPIFHRSIPGTAGGILIQLAITTRLIRVYGTASTTYTQLLISTVAPVVDTWSLIEVKRASGVLSISINGVVVGSVADTTNLTYSTAAARFGLRAASSEAFTGSLALWRISATAPSQSQIEHIYRTELPLFQASAQCTIAGSSAAVTALAYDDTTELLHVGTSWGRSGFKDLLRVDSEATTTGALTSLSASQGVIITGGTSGKVYVPAMLLRDELRRKDEARKALGKTPVFFDYTATASQTAFVAPKGYTIKAVYHNGTLKRETTTGVYWTRSSDGFAETCTLSAGATVSDWISLMCVRT